MLKLCLYSPMVAFNLHKSLIKPTVFIDEETKVQWGPASLPSAAIRTRHLASLGILDYGDSRWPAASEC